MNYPYFFLILSFFEGGTVMAAELLGAKMLAPFFGSSLYVWTTTLAMTLGALTLGYFVGGHLSVTSQRSKILLRVLLMASACVACMPTIAGFLLNAIPLNQLWLSLLLAGLLILFPPVFFLGMVSPLIIAELADTLSAPGKAAGMIYAVSTLGGIFYTFLFGFWVIPTFGLGFPAIFCGLFLASLSVLFLLKSQRLTSVLGLMGLALLLIWTSQNKTALGKELRVLSQREGLLGQVMVTDYQPPGGGLKRRYLLVNRVVQTEFVPGALQPYSAYAHQLNALAQRLPVRDRALVLGLGGGAVTNLLLKEAGFAKVEACEFDRRIYEAAQQYFGLDPRVPVTIDDARHHLRQIQAVYALVVFDLFRGEESPEHVLTLESLQQLRPHVRADGALMINSHGYIHGAAGLGNRSLIRTLRKAGYVVRVFATSRHEATSNLLILATPSPYILATLTRTHPPELLPIELSLSSQAQVLLDDRPVLNALNTQASANWRKAYLQSMDHYREQGVPAFR